MKRVANTYDKQLKFERATDLQFTIAVQISGTLNLDSKEEQTLSITDPPSGSINPPLLTFIVKAS